MILNMVMPGFIMLSKPPSMKAAFYSFSSFSAVSSSVTSPVIHWPISAARIA
jgi:hypothetical protein